MVRRWLIFFLLLMAPPLTFHAKVSLLPDTTSSPVLLTESQDTPTPFRLSANFDLKEPALIFDFQIAEGYHLYQEPTLLETTMPNTIGSLNFPPGEFVQDPALGDQTIYQHKLSLRAPIMDNQAEPFHVTLRYQGCKGKTFCLPPQAKTFYVNIPKHLIQATATIQSTLNDHNDTPLSLQRPSSSIKTLLSFLLLGVLLAFSPCILPILPILSGLLLGTGPTTMRQQILLGGSFVIGNTIVLTLLGLGATLIGAALQAFIQTVWFLIPIAIMLILMALSLLDYLPTLPITFFTIKPATSPEGSYLKAFFLGLGSGLIFSPCISPPLMGILLLVTVSRDYWLGGVSLFMLGLGMGLPLMAISIFGTRILPKRGAWMHQIKILCAILLLGLAIYLVSRLIPTFFSTLAYALLSLSYGLYLFRLSWQKQTRIARIPPFLIGIGTLLFSGNLAIQALRPHLPFRSFFNTITASSQLSWQTLSRQDALDQALLQAKQEKKPVIIDVYASWCIACRIIETEVFPEPFIQERLQQFTRIRLDISQPGPDLKPWLAQHYILGPPAQLMFNVQGKWLIPWTLYGEITAQQLDAALEATLP